MNYLELEKKNFSLVFKNSFKQFINCFKRILKNILILSNHNNYSEYLNLEINDSKFFFVNLINTQEVKLKENQLDINSTDFCDIKCLENIFQFCKKYNLIILNDDTFILKDYLNFIEIYLSLLDVNGILFIENMHINEWIFEIKNKISKEFTVKNFDEKTLVVIHNSFLTNDNLHLFNKFFLKLKLVYFAYLIPNKWESIIDEQLSALVNCGLYEEAQDIYMSVITDHIELKKLKIKLEKKYPKIKLMNIYNENYYEYPGIKTIFDISTDEHDTCLLYFHSKGMTSNKHENRRKLFKYTIQNYKDWIANFWIKPEIDVISAIPHKNGFAYFNYFWVRSSYVKKYCCEPKITQDRYFWEIWLGKPYSKKSQVITWSPYFEYETFQYISKYYGPGTPDYVITNILL